MSLPDKDESMPSSQEPTNRNRRAPVVHTWAVSEDSLVTAMTFPSHGEWFCGHFPGFPVLPGVAQLFFIRKFARKAFADFPDVASYRRIKFRRLVRPDERVVLEVARRGVVSFAFTMSVDGEVASSGSMEGATGDMTIASAGIGFKSGYLACGEASLPRSVITDLLPHRPPMTMLSEVLAVDVPGEAFAVADTSADSIFYEPDLGGLPSCVAIEYMAQTMALAVGAESRRIRLDPKIGFILGTRRLNVRVDSFLCARRYVVGAKCTSADEEFASFDCAIAESDGRIVASASLTAFQPIGDPVEFAAKMRKLNKG